MTHHRQVVCNEEVRQLQLLAQVLQEIQHTGLNRHVKGRHRLIKYQQLRVESQGTGDADALFLATGEVPRITIGVSRFQTHQGHELVNSFRDLVLRVTVVLQWLSNNVNDRQPGIQGCHRILEDDLEVLTGPLALPRIHLGGVMAQDDDVPSLRLGQLKDRHDRCRLPASRFTDQSKGLALLDPEGDAINSMNCANAPLEDRTLHKRVRLDKVLDVQNVLQGLTV